MRGSLRKAPHAGARSVYRAEALAAPPDPIDLLARFAAIGDRGPCSDGERLAARQAVKELRGIGRRGVRTTTVWVRPAGPWVGTLIALAGVVASVVSVDHAAVGLATALAAAVLLIDDIAGRAPLLRRFTYARATQNVVSDGGRSEAPVRLIVTAALDTPAGGILDGDGLIARFGGRTRRRLHGHLPGRYGLLLLALLGIAAGCGARLAGEDAQWLGAVQFVPTLVALAAAALLVDAATAKPGQPGAGANASAAAVALALVAELDRRPPRALAVDLVLAGAGEAGALGLRAWVVERQRAGVKRDDVAVLHIAPCGHGTPVWWTRDGLAFPLRYHPQLTLSAARVAADEAYLGARPHQSRGTSGARRARAARWPALAIGAVDDCGVVPRAGHATDTPDAIDRDAVDNTLQLALGIVAALDADLATAHDLGSGTATEAAVSPSPA